MGDLQMKKFLKIMTTALVFGLTLVTFVACHHEQPISSRNETPDQDTANTPITDTTVCGPDCNCKNPIICDHEICEHEWEDWLEVTDADNGKLIKILRCTKDHQHITYEVSDIIVDPEQPDDPVVEPIKPEFTLDDEHLGNTTWQNKDGGTNLVFYADKTYEFGENNGGTWVISGNTIHLTENKNALIHGTTFQLNFDADNCELSHESFYNSNYSFILVGEVVE